MLTTWFSLEATVGTASAPPFFSMHSFPVHTTMQAHPSRLTLSAAALALLGSTALGQGLTQLGSGIAQGISADGTTVVGGGNSGAWAWNATLGQLPLNGPGAVGVSSDGTVVFGEDGVSNGAGAVWTNGSGWQSIGGLPSAASGCPDFGSPYNISDTGDVATGLGWDGCSAFAYRWTSAGGVEKLPQQGPNNSRGNDVSGDGTHIGGWDEAPNGTRRASIWFPNGTEQIILEDPVLNPEGAGEVWGFSTDGTWACGSGSGGAFRWNATDGVEYLGSLPGFSGATGLAISDDGKTVVGFAGIAFFGITAFIWTEAGGMQRFRDYAMTELGVTLPGTQDFQVLHDMTPDGSKVVGYYSQDAGPFSPDTAVLVDLPSGCGVSTYGVGLSPVNYLNLVGGGSTSVGGTFQPTTSGSTGSVTISFLSLSEANTPALGGVALINAAQIVSTLSETPVGGSSTNSISIPANPALANLDIYLQSISDDAGQPFGFALSNGLQLTICP